MEHFPEFPDYLLAFLFGAVIPFFSGARQKLLLEGEIPVLSPDQKKKFYLGNSGFLALSALLILWVWGSHHRPPAALGLQWPVYNSKTLLLSLLITFFLLYFADLFPVLMRKKNRPSLQREIQQQAPFLPKEPRDFPYYLVMCASAGVSEEIIYRGFLVTFFHQLFQGIPASGLWTIMTPALLFSLAHAYQGRAAVFKITVLALIFGMIFLYTGSLLLVIILHIGVDVISGAAGYWLIHRASARPTDPETPLKN